MHLPLKHALKTAVAAMVAMLTSRALGITDSSWAVISAVIVMQVNLGSSLSASRSRILGTTIGALVGAAGVWVLGVTPWSVGAMLIVTILLCTSLRLEDGYRLAAATTAIVMLAEGPDVWSVGFYRFVNVILGILAAVAVSMFLWPSRAKDHLREGLADVVDSCADLYRLLIDVHLTGRYPQQQIVELRGRIKRRFRANRDLLKDCAQEPAGETGEMHLLAALMGDAERLIEHVLAMDDDTKLGKEPVHGKEPASGQAGAGPGGITGSGREGEIEKGRVPAGQGQGNLLCRELDSSVMRLADTTRATLASLVGTLRPRSTAQPREANPDAVPDLEAAGILDAAAILDTAALALDEQLTALRKSGRIRSHGLEDVLDFFSFVHGMKRVAKDLSLMAAKAGELRRQ
jgi:hypothetical protein